MHITSLPPSWKYPQGGPLFVVALNDVCGWSWDKIPYVWENYSEKRGLCTNGMLHNKPMYIY